MKSHLLPLDPVSPSPVSSPIDLTASKKLPDSLRLPQTEVEDPSIQLRRFTRVRRLKVANFG